MKSVRVKNTYDDLALVRKTVCGGESCTMSSLHSLMNPVSENWLNHQKDTVVSQYCVESFSNQVLRLTISDLDLSFKNMRTC